MVVGMFVEVQHYGGSIGCGCRYATCKEDVKIGVAVIGEEGVGVGVEELGELRGL